MADASPFFRPVLDPADRVGEVLFGLIMVLTSTTALSVATAGHAEVKTMIIGALGCNLAWGIIDAGMYLIGCLDERARGPMMLRDLRRAGSPEQGNRVIADALPAEIVASLSDGDLNGMRQKLLRHPEVAVRPHLTTDDWLGALAIAVLVFLSTFPVVIPFFFFAEVQPALRVSNAIAIAMLFMCGYMLARTIGGRPWVTGGVMVAIGCILVAVAIALGG
jgi:hypothetical protein